MAKALPLLSMTILLSLVGLLPRTVEAQDTPGQGSGDQAPPTVAPSPDKRLGIDLSPTLDQATPGELEIALTEFSKANKDSAEWGDRLSGGAECKVAGSVVYLLYNADGSNRCDIAFIPEDYIIEAAILVPEDQASKYTIEIRDGERTRPNVVVRGTSDEAKSAATKAKELLAQSNVGAKVLFKRSAPIKGDTVSVKRSISGTKIEKDNQYKVEPLYQVNLGLLIGIGIGARPESFSVQDGKIASSKSSSSAHYMITFSLYPFAFHERNGRWKYGRYFTSRDSFSDRISLNPGLSIDSPKNVFYLGIGLEVMSGLSVGVGWAPSRVDKLTAGHAVGDDTADTAAPTEKRWRFDQFVLGLSIDTVLAGKVVKFLAL